MQRRLADIKRSITSRLARGRYERAAQWYHQSGSVHYGYIRENDGSHKKIIPYEPEAALVRFIFTKYLMQGSLHKLLSVLDAQVKRTRKGKMFSREGLHFILTNETYAGWVHFGDVSTMGNHPSFISQELFDDVGRKLRARNRQAKRSDTSLEQRIESET